MTKEAVFTLKIETELRDQFMAEAEATHRPASQIVRDLMRDYVARQREAREYDAWFRAEVQKGLDDLDDPNVELIPHEQVVAERRKWRAALLKRIEEEEKLEEGAEQAE
jgi:predicted transcriptional regulator